MSSDRGTMQRGPISGTDQQAGWQAPTAPGGRRLPSAPRERRPGLAALAVLLIVGGALGAGFLITKTGKRVAAIEIVHQVGVGQRIPQTAMQEVQIASDSSVNYVPWNEASQVAEFYAANAIPPGTLLNGAMVVRANHVVAGRDVLGLALKEGQLPGGLQVGDHIDIYDVSDANNSCPGSPGSTLAGNAIVIAIATPSVGSGSSAQANVQVALDPRDAGAVACNASNGIVGVAVLPAGGHGLGSGGSPSPQPGNGGQSAGQGGQPSGGASASPPPSGTRTG
jgi:hypothetical protein